MGVALKKGWLTAALVLERVCEVCRGNERASPIELDATFPSGDMTPPGHPNACFAGTSFAPYGGLRNLFRARYDGPAITIEAEILQDGVEATSGDSSCSDNRLAVNIPSEQFSNLGNLSGCDFLRVPVPVAPDRVVITIGPNHPMLTRRGWVKARDIQDGDELLYDSRVEFVAGAVNPDLEKVPPFEDIFSSLTSVLGYTRVAGPAYYFHGDEAFVYGEVNAVGSARGLLTVLDPGGLEHVSEDDFSRSDPDLASLAPYGVSATLLERIFLEARGSMRRGKHGGSLMLSGARPSNFHRARVTRHESTSFVGFAFDAETDSGIYNAGGFVVKNCRCALLPVVVDETTEKSAPSRFVCEAEKSFSPSEARGPDGKWIGGAGFIIASSKAEQKAMLQANWAKHGRALDYDDIFESHPGLFEREAKLWNKKHGTNIDGENYHFGSNRDFEAHFEAQHLDGKIAPFPGVKEANDFFENQDGHGPSHAVYLRGQEPA